jgi:quercetin dioxygenase-like cupin family protein
MEHLELNLCKRRFEDRIDSLLARDQVTIVRRQEIPFIQKILTQQGTYLLGEHRDFHKHPVLREFIPESARLGIAWVHLKSDETLAPHTHPIESMILICEGQVKFLGQFNCDLFAGDIVVVPRGALHGFRGAGPAGFHGISIQFENRGLYEDPQNPLVEFRQKSNFSTILPDSLPSELWERNQIYKKGFKNNILFQKFLSGYFARKSRQKIFLRYFQIWSDQFQKSMLLKTALCDDVEFKPLFRKHFNEEIHHDQDLHSDRIPDPDDQPLFDAQLVSLGTWFQHKMLTSSAVQQILIMNLCVEGAAQVFYEFAAPVLNPHGQLKHFNKHESVDNEHEKLGLEYLQNLTPKELRPLQILQHQTWQVLSELFTRLSDLSSQDVAHESDI